MSVHDLRYNRRGSGGSGAASNLEQVLSVGNLTGPYDISVDDEQKVIFNSTADNETIDIVSNSSSNSKISVKDSSGNKIFKLSQDNSGCLELHNNYVSITDDNGVYGGDYFELGGGGVFAESKGYVQLNADTYVLAESPFGAMFIGNSTIGNETSVGGLYILRGDTSQFSFNSSNPPFSLSSRRTRYLGGVGTEIENTGTIGGQDAVVNGNVKNSGSIGGVGITLDKDGYAFVQNLEVQGGTAAFTVDPTGLPEWTNPRSIPDRNYVETLHGTDLGEFTVAGLPDATLNLNKYALATDAVGGRTVVRSDGANWKVIAIEGMNVSV